MGLDAFISYSHAADGAIAPALERGLERLARPWNRLRAVSVFRDQTDLSLTPHLWTTIRDALDEAGYFVLLASAESALSAWVGKEVAYWCDTKGPDRVFIVWTGGTLAWDPEAGDFTPDSTACPPALRGRLAEEPLYLDLRWARDVADLSLSQSRFRAAVAQIAAPIRGIPPDELEGEDIRLHRRARRLARAAVATLTVLALTLAGAAALAVANARRAEDRARQATARQVGLDALDLPSSDLDRAFLLSLVAARLDPEAGSEAFRPSRVLIGRNARLESLLHVPAGATGRSVAGLRAVALTGSGEVVAAAAGTDGSAALLTWPVPVDGTSRAPDPRTGALPAGTDPTSLRELPDGSLLVGRPGSPVTVRRADGAVTSLHGTLLDLAARGEGLVADADGGLQLVDLGSGRVLSELPAAAGGEGRVAAWVARPDATVVGVTRGRALVLLRRLDSSWSAAAPVQVPEAAGDVRALAVAPDGGRVLVVGQGAAILLDTDSGAVLATDLGGGGAAAVEPGGRFVAVGGRRLTVWDLATGQRTLAVPTPANAMAWSGPCGESASCRLVTAGESLDVWSLTGRRVMLAAQTNAQAVAVSADASTVATAGWGAAIAVWRLTASGDTSGRTAVPASRPVGGTLDPRCAGPLRALSPDGALLAFHDPPSGTTTVCDVAGGAVVARARLRGSAAPASALAVDDLGDVALGGGAGVVERYPRSGAGWRTGTGVDARLGGGAADVRSLSLRAGIVAAGLRSPAGIGGAQDVAQDVARVLVWDVERAGTPVQFDVDQRDVPAVRLLGARGEALVVAGRDESAGPVTLQVWESASRRRVGRALTGLAGDVVRLGGDATAVVGQDAGGRAYRWELDRDPTREICGIVGRALTPREWRSAAGGALEDYPYDPVCPDEAS